jgi:hypothetical protein
MRQGVFGRAVVMVATVLALGLVGFGHARAQECDIEFADAEFFIEINGTDGDAGVQLDLDGEGWNELEMVDPNGIVILELSAPPGGGIGMQGLTELFFESAEPSFDEQPLQELFDLFPEGEYEFEGVTTEGESICATAEFTHNVPAIPEPEVEVEVECDEDGEAEIEVEICWEAVEDPFDDPNGADVGDEIEIDMYRLIVSALDEEGEENETLDVELPADALCMDLPEEFIELSPVGEFKYEVLATEESGNQTIFEDEFSIGDVELEDDECDDDDEDEDEDDDEWYGRGRGWWNRGR